jgi:hypothetical protein
MILAFATGMIGSSSPAMINGEGAARPGGGADRAQCALAQQTLHAHAAAVGLSFRTSRSAEVRPTNTRREDDRTDGLATFKISVDLCRLL